MVKVKVNRMKRLTTVQLTEAEICLLRQIQPLRGGATLTHLVREAIRNYYSAELIRLTSVAGSPTPQQPQETSNYLETFQDGLFDD